MASVMLATYPELFAGGAIIAGLAYGRASSVPEAFDCMRGQRLASDEELWALLRAASPHDGPWPRITIWQGTADHTVAPSNAEDIAAQWRSVHGSARPDAERDARPACAPPLEQCGRRHPDRGEHAGAHGPWHAGRRGSRHGRPLYAGCRRLLDARDRQLLGDLPARDADAQTAAPRRTTKAHSPTGANAPATRLVAPPASAPRQPRASAPSPTGPACRRPSRTRCAPPA